MSDARALRAAVPLVTTKLHAPRRRRGLVPRPRLSSRIADRDRPALTLVSAPAGFGKTTLLAQWFDAQRSAAWLSLDPRDNDPARFWAYLVAALQTVRPGLGAAALRSAETAPSSVEAAVASLVNDLDALEENCVLVLDDYHVIESVEVHDVLALLVEQLPAQLSLVIASRSDPPLPLPRLRARGDLLEIRAADLRFTGEEARAYFTEAMGLELTSGNIEALEARTEGWIAALQLAALSLRGRADVDSFIDSFTGDVRFVVDYLVDEVLERQRADVRAFLLQTAILTRMTGSLCDAVAGGSGGAALLEELDRANLFLVPLDDRRLWYRYHHLFGDVLRARLLDEHADWVPELHRRASAWYEATGDLPDAIGHALAGDDTERAARLIEVAAPAMRRSRQEATLRSWLEALPAELFDSRPVLTAIFVGARMASGDATGVEPLLAGAEQWMEGRRPGGPVVFDQEEFDRLPAQVAMYRAGLALLTGDTDQTIAHADRIVDLAEPSDHFLLGGAAALTGLAHWSRGDLEPARRNYSAAVQHFVDAGFIPDVLGCSLALGDIQVAQGRLEDAKATFDGALKRAQAWPGLRGTADMHVGLSELFLERNELDRAVRELEASTALGDHAGLPQHGYRWRVAAARLRAAQGDVDDALGLLDGAERFYNTDFSPSVRPIPSLRARMDLAGGDLVAARRWASDRGLGVDDDLDYVHEFEHITLARILLADGDGRAVALLERLNAAARQGERTGTIVETLVLLGRSHQADGDSAAALSALEEAVRRAVPEGYARVFLDEGPAITSLLQRLSLDGAAGAHARRLLDSVPTKDDPTSGMRLVGELSSRELDVLRLLRSDLSGPGIARELLVSLNTLRTHTKNIYTKLGVNNRREAIRRASELGL